MPLDRASTLRKKSAWLNEQVSAENSYFYFYWQSKFLYVDQEILACQRCTNINHIETLTKLNATHGDHLTFLGLENETAHFVYDLSLMCEAELAQWLIEFGYNKQDRNAKFIDFRRSLSLLNPSQASILSYAKALIHWQQSSVFCGRCGNETLSIDGGHRKQCSNEHCQAEQFPRTDPAVIMLVEYQPEVGPAVCLLAEHHRTPEQVYSTLAGFVDPGESLDEAVIREVYEEAGIRVSEVNYIASQPWPFPNSLMLGFIAKATSTDITLEDEELRSAQWFSAEQLTGFHEWGDEAEGAKLPRKESIARLLIDYWCEKQRAQ